MEDGSATDVQDASDVGEGVVEDGDSVVVAWKVVERTSRWKSRGESDCQDGFTQMAGVRQRGQEGRDEACVCMLVG
jgi:hypothetical protein